MSAVADRPVARALTPDADPSAEMEMLRLRRVRRAFVGPTADEGRASPLARGLLGGAAMGALAVLLAGVAGLIGATWEANEREQRQRNPSSTTVAPPSTSAPVIVAPPRPTTRPTRRVPPTTANV